MLPCTEIKCVDQIATTYLLQRRGGNLTYFYRLVIVSALCAPPLKGGGETRFVHFPSVRGRRRGRAPQVFAIQSLASARAATVKRVTAAALGRTVAKRRKKTRFQLFSVENVCGMPDD